jgi:hypothetical protein
MRDHLRAAGIVVVDWEMIGHAERALIKTVLSPVAATGAPFFNAAGAAAGRASFSLKRDRLATDSLRGLLRGYLQGR